MHSDLAKGANTITFEPNPIRPGLRYGRFTEIIHEEDWRGQTGDLANHKFLEVAGYLGNETDGYQARIWDKCTVNPQSIGGDGGGTLGLSYQATFAGQITYGTVDKLLPPLNETLTATSLEFTPEVP